VLVIGIASAVMLRSDPTIMGLPSVQAAEDKKEDKHYKHVAAGIAKDPRFGSCRWPGRDT